jgi:sec-independent protein translocase protein TatA
MILLDPASSWLQVPLAIEWIIIIGAIIIALFFGAKKIPELARSFGRASGEYEKARIDARKELELLKNQGTDARDRLESIARTLGIDHTGKSNDELRKAIQSEINKKEKT